jgi:hypothetical protein
VEIISSGVFVIAYFISMNYRLLQELQVGVRVMLRPTVSWPVYLGAKHPSEEQDQIVVIVRKLWVC